MAVIEMDGFRRAVFSVFAAAAFCFAAAAFSSCGSVDSSDGTVSSAETGVTTVSEYNASVITEPDEELSSENSSPTGPASVSGAVGSSSALSASSRETDRPEETGRSRTQTAVTKTSGATAPPVTSLPSSQKPSVTGTSANNTASTAPTAPAAVTTVTKASGTSKVTTTSVVTTAAKVTTTTKAATTAAETKPAASIDIRDSILSHVSSDNLKSAAASVFSALEQGQSTVTLPDGLLKYSEAGDFLSILSLMDVESHIVPSSMTYTVSKDYVTKITVSSYPKTASQYAKEKQAVNKAADEIVAKARKECSSAYEMAVYFNDYICRNCVYDLSAENGSSAYGCLVEGKAVCEGYAKAMTLLCSKAGIKCIEVVGTGTSAGTTEAHMWNLIELDGVWSHVDVTWNDIDKGSLKGAVSHCYFGMTDKEISLSHSASQLSGYALPKASSNEAGYLIRMGLYVSSQNDLESVLSKAITASVKSKDPVVEVRCASANLYAKAKDTELLFRLIKEASAKYYASGKITLSFLNSSGYDQSCTLTLYLNYN